MNTLGLRMPPFQPHPPNPQYGHNKTDLLYSTVAEIARKLYMNSFEHAAKTLEATMYYYNYYDQQRVSSLWLSS